MRKTFTDFLDFIRTRGVVAFAVGFILGKAVSDMVSSFVNDILNPVISIFSNRINEISDAAVSVGSVTIAYGKFLSLTINFLLLTIVVYFGVRLLRLEKLDKIK